MCEGRAQLAKRAVILVKIVVKHLVARVAHFLPDEREQPEPKGEDAGVNIVEQLALCSPRLLRRCSRMMPGKTKRLASKNQSKTRITWRLIRLVVPNN